MTATHSERERFVALVQQHAGGDPGLRYSFAQRLMRYNATYRRLQAAAGERLLRNDELQKVRQLTTRSVIMATGYGCALYYQLEGTVLSMPEKRVLLVPEI
jgi:hypothetical protein